MSVILKAENISKQYRLGTVGTGTISHDFNRWWHQIRGKEDPYLKVGAVNDRSAKANEEYVWALRDINFEVKTGEVLGIIGKNGAGKSTLLKLLSRVTSPTTGSIKTKGRIASLLEVGTGFHPELTGRENIYLNGAILGMTKPEIRSKIDEIIAFSGCEMYIDTPVKRYSSGMRVRLGFAVAAHLEPEILVVDEVLAVGDAEFQKKAIGKMQDLSSGEGRTVLFVSHNMASIQQLCDRVIVLSNGSIVFEGDVDSGIRSYLKSNQTEEKAEFPFKLPELIINSFSLKSVLSEENRYTYVIGQPLIIEINISNKLDRKLHLNIRLQLLDKNGEIITTLNTFHVGQLYHLNPGEKEKIVTCVLKKIAIAPGSYAVGLQLLDMEYKKELIASENVSKINIESGDYFKTGRIPNKENMGKFFVDYDWK
ncbi:MAG: ABC transporter ATP-binding protein [Zunongwangia sp.]|jgi:lipopolysaccharide transport system ATP-binding protein|uniref:ABC transporter ATP-binding protein n=1 Tax=Zunongwangia profunda TaxID=398743 RepID=UPI000C93445B|nr:ABC transporter ATP-binding protein [Zunongwangia profunda]MAO35661.1 ABC transporter ATP-binding protein [Zunongwangia sp.]MCC4230158.1 ATP-binding cassette domain-containing protein [Zunongwangia profunda]|tara:strand:+ start:1906 stop:3177 length:1272 start_codon:yes stop_codon:yes gene_type:complete